ncbi:MAG: hypothetical protein N2645_14305 [Clostridia bacterium]|nr:hypothetical protein [Clostridia bacterium]
MGFKVTISGETTLEKCVQSTSLRIDPPDNYIDSFPYTKNSIEITGLIGTGEPTHRLYEWSLLQANDPLCYKEVIVEEIKADVLVRKVIFSKAFVVNYTENYTNTGF